MDELSEAIRAAMRKKNCGPDVLAKEADIARTTLFDLLSGRGDPRLSTLKKLKAAGVRIPRDLLAA